MKFKQIKKQIIIDALKRTPKEDVYSFIRANLQHHSTLDTGGKIKYRFDMSYNAPINNRILNIFEPLGIRNCYRDLVLSFWKGGPDLYFLDSIDNEMTVINYYPEGDLSGLGTVDIIYKIFEHTIFTRGLDRFGEEECINELDFVRLDYLLIRSQEEVRELMNQLSQEQ
tara:strand:+ start:455 stop:961 length:507 start_codon:yes stop_codon:yes gene_type:complete